MIHHNNSSNGTEWLLVDGIPLDAFSISISQVTGWLCWVSIKTTKAPIQLPPGQWELFCKASTATEEQAAEIVYFADFYEIGIKGFEDYAGKFLEAGSEYHFDNATQSLQSLLISHNLTPSTLIIKKLK